MRENVSFEDPFFQFNKMKGHQEPKNEKKKQQI